MGVEGLFMEWIIKALKPNGKAFIVVPDGIFNRQNDKILRQFIIEECFIDGIISLPVKTFFTTPKKTYILCITKKVDKKIVQTAPVFTYLVSEIGESRDVYRFDIERDDLTEAITLYSFFKGNKSNFEKINVDKRCKIQAFSKFMPESYWSIERWWTQEEKTDLGIVDKNDLVSMGNLSELLTDFSTNLTEYADLLNTVSQEKIIQSNFKKVELSNKYYFKLSIGKRIVKRQLLKIQGTIPIYSANVKKPIGFHNNSNIKDFNNNFVLWGIDGDFEFNVITKNKPFVSTDHCGVIRILNDEILPEYLMIQLEKVKHNYGFDRGLRASLKNMKEVCIKLPFNKDGSINIAKQKEVIRKNEYILELKEKITTYKDLIFQLNIDMNIQS